MNSSKKIITLALAVTAYAVVHAEMPSATALMSNKNVTTDLKMRYVNSMEAWQASTRGKDEQKKLEEKRNELTARVQKEEENIKQVVTEYKSKEAMLNKSARSEEEAKIVKLQREYETIVKTCEDDLKLAMQNATEVLSLEVEKTVAELAQKEEYDVITDIFTGRIIYASPKAMITDDLITAMNADASVTNKAVATV